MEKVTKSSNIPKLVCFGIVIALSTLAIYARNQILKAFLPVPPTLSQISIELNLSEEDYLQNEILSYLPDVNSVDQVYSEQLLLEEGKNYIPSNALLYEFSIIERDSIYLTYLIGCDYYVVSYHRNGVINKNLNTIYLNEIYEYTISNTNDVVEASNINANKTDVIQGKLIIDVCFSVFVLAIAIALLRINMLQKYVEQNIQVNLE